MLPTPDLVEYTPVPTSCTPGILSKPTAMLMVWLCRLARVPHGLSRYAFGFLHTTKRPEAAVAVLHNDALPFYQERGLPVEAIITDNGREFCGKDTHPYELYLDLNDIEHRRTRVRRPQTNGFVERFNNTVLNEFVRALKGGSGMRLVAILRVCRMGGSASMRCRSHLKRIRIGNENDQVSKGHLVDALACTGDEGRDTLR